jgi:hypothetical protein
VGISGRITQPGQTDRYAIAGTQGQTISIQTLTRSLGLPTLLKLAVLHPNGNVLGQTAINESDEWQLDITFPETGIYTIVASDLLGRSGPRYAYWIEAAPKPPFAVGIKPDPKTLESRLLESGAGSTWIDLTIQRAGYDGPIQIEWVHPFPGLRILNPSVPAKAAEHRIFLATDPSWDPSRIGQLQWTAKQVDGGSFSSPVQTIALKRAKLPHQPFPTSGTLGQLAFASMAPGEPFFQAEFPPGLTLAAPIKQHVISGTIKRLKEEFKEPVTLLSVSGPQGWTVQPTLDKDTLKHRSLQRHRPNHLLEYQRRTATLRHRDRTLQRVSERRTTHSR